MLKEEPDRFNLFGEVNKSIICILSQQKWIKRVFQRKHLRVGTSLKVVSSVLTRGEVS